MAEKSLIPIDKFEPKELFLGEKYKDVIAFVKAESTIENPTVETKEGQAEIRSTAARIGSSCTFLEKIRLAQSKEIRAEVEDRLKMIIDNGKLLQSELRKWQAEVRKPLTDFEKAEQERLEELARIEMLNTAYDEAKAEDDLWNRQKEIERKEAEYAAIEAERLEKERIAREAKEKEEREKRIAQEAADKAKREAEEKAEREKQAAIDRENQLKLDAEKAEREKKEAIERAEREKQEAIEAEKQRAKEEADRMEKERVEKERIEAERIEAERIKAERKAANRNHMKAINNQALKCFVQNGIEETSARAIVEMIAKRLIDNVTINY